MKTSIFQGTNLSNLPLTHCGSVYLLPHIDRLNYMSRTRFEKFVNEWVEYGNGAISLIDGSIEQGKRKGLYHLQWVATADDNFFELTESFVKAHRVIRNIEKRLVKVANRESPSGYSDTFFNVESITFRSKKGQISAEAIIDKSASALYAKKCADWGINTIIVCSNSII